MKLGIDLDGVLADFVTAFTVEAVALGLTDKVLRTSEQLAWKFPYDTDAVWRRIDDTPNWWIGVPLLASDDEMEALNALVDEHELYFVTSRFAPLGHMSAAEQTRRWLLLNGVRVSRSNVVAGRGINKGYVYRGLGVDLAIDDNPSVLADVDAHAPHTKVVMRRHPYNAHLADTYACVDSLGEFMERYL